MIETDNKAEEIVKYHLWPWSGHKAWLSSEQQAKEIVQALVKAGLLVRADG